MDMDKLDSMFHSQSILQARFNAPRLVTHQLNDIQPYINLMLLALHDEVSELQRETCWKNPLFIQYGWKNSQSFNRKNYVQELVDILHFVINLALVADITSQELFESFDIKNKENHSRKTDGY